MPVPAHQIPEGAAHFRAVGNMFSSDESTCKRVKEAVFLQIKNAAAEARKEGKRDMRSSHLPLITAEYELLRREIIEDAKVLTKVKLLSSDKALQQFLGAPAQAVLAAAGGAQEQDAPTGSAQDV